MNEEQDQEILEDSDGVPKKKPLQLNPKRTEHKKKTKWFLYVAAVIAVIGLGLGSYFAYDYYMHADDVTVPKAQTFVEYKESRDALCNDFKELSLNCSVEWKTSEEADRGNLLSQSIASGTVVSPNSKIVLTYSDGPPNSVFPNLSGQDLEESKELLYNLGLVVSEVKEVDNNTVPTGRIVTANIEPGTQVENGTEITIEISNGASVVPDWIGETKEFVEADAQSKNLNVVFETLESTDVAPGVVMNQSVMAGEVSKDSSVKVTIAKSPESVSIAVPDVLELTEEEAVSQLATSGFKNITVSVVEASADAERVVVDVVPGVGQNAEADSQIVVIISEPVSADNNTEE